MRGASVAVNSLLLGILAGVLQGVAEWLPVSSKTMVLLLLLISGYSAQIAYVVGLAGNAGTAAAAAIYFRRELWEALRSIQSGSDEARSLLVFLVVATFTTALIGVPLYVLVKESFREVHAAGAMLVIGVLLIATSLVSLKREKLLAEGVGWKEKAGLKEAVIAGLAQGLAVLPGISRSGTTITALLLMGLKAEDSLRYSFMMAVPACIGAGLVDLAVGGRGLGAVDFQLGSALLVVSAVVGIATLKALLMAARRFRFSVFTGILGVIAVAASTLMWV